MKVRCLFNFVCCVGCLGAWLRFLVRSVGLFGFGACDGAWGGLPFGLSRLVSLSVSFAAWCRVASVCRVVCVLSGVDAGDVLGDGGVEMEDLQDTVAGDLAWLERREVCCAERCSDYLRGVDVEMLSLRTVYDLHMAVADSHNIARLGVELEISRRWRVRGALDDVDVVLRKKLDWLGFESRRHLDLARGVAARMSSLRSGDVLAVASSPSSAVASAPGAPPMFMFDGEEIGRPDAPEAPSWLRRDPVLGGWTSSPESDE